MALRDVQVMAARLRALSALFYARQNFKQSEGVDASLLKYILAHCGRIERRTGGGSVESKDIEICKELALYLYNIAPGQPKTILLIAALSPEGDVGQQETYSNDGVKEEQFFTNDEDMMKMHELLSSHQRLMVSQNQPAWKRCDFTVTVATGKFSMRLGYEDNMFMGGSLRA